MPFPLKFSVEESLAIDVEIQRLLNIGAIEHSIHQKGEFISNIFTRKKPNGKIRIIINLKPLNQYLTYTHFKMEHLDFVSELVNKDDWFASIDLTDAYFAVSIHQSHWKFLKFLWRGELYHYKCLSFGISQSPYCFTRLCKPILAVLRGTYHLRCSLYIDDMILVSGSKCELNSAVTVALELLSDLGFTVNMDKSVLEPTRNIKHLGFMVDSRNLSFSIPREKLELIRFGCTGILAKANHVKIRTVAKIIGQLVAYSQGAEWGRLHYRDLEREKIQALKSSRGDYDAHMTLSSKALENFRFWLSKDATIPRGFGHIQFEFIMSSDASKLGWGASCGNQNVGGRWHPDEAIMSINWLELYACLLALKAFAALVSNNRVSVKLDNLCAIHYINNQGGVIESLNDLSREFWAWCKHMNVKVYASHVPGVENTAADFCSRHFKDNTEWSLSDDVFGYITSQWGNPDVDLFASRLNHKVDQYFSWQPDPGCCGVDAFSVNWSKFSLAYAFPPFGLVGKVVKKALCEGANLILVAPYWPSQHWFPVVYGAMICEPLVLPVEQSTIKLCHDVSKAHPIWNKLNLTCFRFGAKR